MTVYLSSALKFLLVVVILSVLYFSKTIVLAALIGVGVGVLLSPLLDLFQRWFRLRRAYGAILIILIFLVLAGTVLGLFGWVITDQINALVDGMPELTSKLRGQLTFVFERFPWMLEQIKGFDAASSIQAGLNYFIIGAQAGVSAIGGVVFALFIGLYLAVDRDFYFKGIVRAFPPAHRKKAESVFLKSAKVVRVWFRAQLIDMLLIGLITTVGLWMVGVAYWAVLGLLTALLGIVPYVGVMIVVVIASLLTLASDPSLVPWVMLVFFVTQQIEGNLILPLVMKGQVEIPEALLIVVMLFFGFWFGLLGVFVAPPMVAVMICLYRTLYLPRIEKKI